MTNRRIRVHRLGSIQDSVSNPICGSTCPKHRPQDVQAGYVFGAKPYMRCAECLMVKEVERGFSYLESVERGKVFRRLKAEYRYAKKTVEIYRMVDEVMANDSD